MKRSIAEIRAAIADGWPVSKLERTLAEHDRSAAGQVERSSYSVSTYELDDSERHQCNPVPMPVDEILEYVRRRMRGDMRQEAWFRSVAAHEPMRVRMTEMSEHLGYLVASHRLGHRDDEAKFRAEVAEVARLTQEQENEQRRAMFEKCSCGKYGCVHISVNVQVSL
jgi:hypothetical protein